jgi:sugar lactone lactonase YvrE
MPELRPEGIEWDDGLMWVTAFNPKAIYLVEPDTFKVLRSFLVDTERLHGLARDGDGIWCAHTTDKVIIKYHTESGEVMERIQLPQDGPAPHGLSIRGGELWYCDANFAGKRSHGTRPEGPEIGRIVSRQASVDGKGEPRLDQQAARHR